MKSITVLLLFAILGFTNCNTPSISQEKTPDAKTEIGKANDYLKKFDLPSQSFKILANKPTQVKGTQGTIIAVNPDDLVTENGQPLGKDIDVELKELFSREQLLRANAPTTSNGKLLVSGGAYYINMTSGGQQLKLKDGKSLAVSFPQKTTSDMFLFYGQRDSQGQMNWEQADQKFEIAPTDNAPLKSAATEPDIDQFNGDEIGATLEYIEQENSRPPTPEEKKAVEERKKNEVVANKVYAAINLKQFGWINCDRFYNTPNITNLQFAFNPTDSIVSANVYLVFNRINSLMQSEYLSVGSPETFARFMNIPLGEKVRVVAFSLKNGKIFASSSELTIKPNETIQLKVNETSQDEFQKILKSI